MAYIQRALLFWLHPNSQLSGSSTLSRVTLVITCHLTFVQSVELLLRTLYPRLLPVIFEHPVELQELFEEFRSHYLRARISSRILLPEVYVVVGHSFLFLAALVDS